MHNYVCGLVLPFSVAIESYTVRLLGDTAEFVMVFSSAVTLTPNQCFFDKLLFADSNDSPNNVYQLSTLVFVVTAMSPIVSWHSWIPETSGQP